MRSQTAAGLKSGRGRPETGHFSKVALRYLLKSNQKEGAGGLVRESHPLLFLSELAGALLKWPLSEPPER